MNEKTCASCKKSKPISAFSVKRANPDGINYDCRECRSSKRRVVYALNAEENRSRQKQRRQSNPEHYRALHNNWRRNNLDKIKDGKLRRDYHITLEQRRMILEHQGGKCPSCGTTDPALGQWAIDHDHACCPETCKSCGDCIRGLLCHTCNRALGLLKDNPTTIRNLLAYLENPPAKQVLK